MNTRLARSGRRAVALLGLLGVGAEGLRGRRGGAHGGGLQEDGDAGARDAARGGRGGGICAVVHGDPVLAGELLLGRRHIELRVVELGGADYICSNANMCCIAYYI